MRLLCNLQRPIPLILWRGNGGVEVLGPAWPHFEDGNHVVAVIAVVEGAPCRAQLVGAED